MKKKPPTALANWQPPQPPADMRMTLITGAEMTAIESDAIKGGDPKKTIKMPVVMAFIRHPKGNVLIDTAFGRNHARHIEDVSGEPLPENDETAL